MMGYSPKYYIPSLVKIGLVTAHEKKIFEVTLIGQAVSEKKIFEIVDDGRTTDGRTDAGS